MTTHYIVYSDGACSGNPGPGGWAWVSLAGGEIREGYGGEPLTTNNRMELMAVLAGLEALKVNPCRVTVYTDSRYVVDSVEKRWVFNWVKTNFKGKKNSDLWKRFLISYPLHVIKFIWIKGHANIPGNERCDQLAVAASFQPNLPDDIGYQNNKE